MLPPDQRQQVVQEIWRRASSLPLRFTRAVVSLRNAGRLEPRDRERVAARGACAAAGDAGDRVPQQRVA
jgi:hypothetical protein